MFNVTFKPKKDITLAEQMEEHIEKLKKRNPAYDILVEEMNINSFGDLSLNYSISAKK